MIDRAELEAIAGDLAGDRSTRRSSALARALAGAPRAAISLEALAATPAWLRLDDDARNALGRRAALLAIAPSLAASIDGAWLRGLAAVAGEDTLDWAASQPGPGKLNAFDGDALPGIAAGIVRVATPAPLRGFVVAGDVGLDPADATALLNRAMHP